MKLNELSAFWIQNEISLQQGMIKKLEQSQMNKIHGFNEVVKMRKHFLNLAKEALKNIETTPIKSKT